MYQIEKNVKENVSLRAGFNSLAEKTFGLNFEGWYQNGFWRDKYIPYSMVKDGRVVANVSVNIMDMRLRGEKKHYLQLGTVMTEESCRRQGLIRRLMEEIAADYAGKTDGVFLFANDSVLDFYPKFGFRQAKEFQYMRENDAGSAVRFEKISMREKTNWKRVEAAIVNNRFQGGLDMMDNSDLAMFYLTQFMTEAVYYDAESDTYAVAESEGDHLLLHAVYGKGQIALDEVISAFGGGIKRVALGFTPLDTAGWQCAEVKEEDTTLFVKGVDFAGNKVMFPTLAHA